jgi:ribonuclease HII
MRQENSKYTTDLIAGLDEVGLGALAGPFLVVVTVFKSDTVISGLKDSKKLTPKKRREALPIIFSNAVHVGWGWATPEMIDELGVAESWQVAAGNAVKGVSNDCFLKVDGLREVRDWKGKQEAVPKADADFWYVSAASIVAKEMRDQVMRDCAIYYPGYGLEKNVGYGSAVHLKKLESTGATPIHRKLYLRKLLVFGVNT